MERIDCAMYTVPNRGRPFCDGLRKLYCKNEECAFYKPKGLMSINHIPKTTGEPYGSLGNNK